MKRGRHADACPRARRVDHRSTKPASEEGGPLVGAMDKATDKLEELQGEAKEKLGQATDNDQLQAEGQADQAKGNLKQAGEKIKDAFS